MRFYLGVTNNNWYNYLKSLSPEDVNFWQPGGKLVFRSLEPGAPFLFKLKYPRNVIGGLGFFLSQTFLPLNMAWEVFGNRNGCESYSAFLNLILQHRPDKSNGNPTIGCIVLTNPIFFNEEDCLEVPSDWSKNIVQGKSYDTVSGSGKELWEKLERLMNRYLSNNTALESEELTISDSGAAYAKNILAKVRLGQGAFRVLVTDAYARRCSITGERTLPVLEAAHIKPYSFSGPHSIQNGILLRSDIHKLFDTGYLTITTDYKTEVSKRIKEEFENGREYYQYHGRELVLLPKRAIERPQGKYIEWHNENVYKG